MSLPPGWRLAQLTDIAEVRLGRQRSPKNHSGTHMRPYLRAANVTWKGLSLNDVKQMHFSDAEMDTYRLRPGDLLLSEASGSSGEVGKPALYAGELGDCAFQNTLLRVRATGDVQPSYLLHYFKQLVLSGQFASGSRGVGIHHLGRARLAATHVPLPSTSEQRRIVNILEDHLSRLDAAQRLLAGALRRCEAWMRGSIDRLVWGDDSVALTAIERTLAEPMRNGHSARAVAHGSTGVRAINLTAVTNRDFSIANTKVTSVDPVRVSSLWLRPGDVLVQRANTPELVGTAARYDGAEDWAIFPDLLIRLRANERVIKSEYLELALRTERAHRTLRAKAKGLAGSMPKIDQSAIGSTVIPLPSLDAQAAIMANVDELRLAERRLRASLEASASRGASLRRALLSAAFAGRLTGHFTDAEVVEEIAAGTAA